MEEKDNTKNLRFVMAIALSLAVLYGYQIFFSPPPPQKPAGQTEAPAQTEDGQKSKAQAGAADPKVVENQQPAKKTATQAKPGKTKPGQSGLEIVKSAGQDASPVYLQSDRFVLQVQPRGARVDRFYLKDYDEKGREFRFPQTRVAREMEINGKKERVIEVTEAEGMDLQVLLNKDELANSPRLNRALFKVEKQTENEILLSTKLRIGGVPVEYWKRYQVLTGENFFTLEVGFRNQGQEAVQLGGPAGNYYVTQMHRLGPVLPSGLPKKGETFDIRTVKVSSYDQTKYYNFAYFDESVEKMPSVAAEGSLFCGAPQAPAKEYKSDVNQPVQYIGSSSKYFLTAMMPLDGPAGSYTFYSDPVDYSRVALGFQGAGLNPAGQSGAERSQRFAVFFGIHEYDQVDVRNVANLTGALKGLNENRLKELKEAFDVSSFIAPFRDSVLFIIRLLHKVIPNYGLVIIVFAIFFKLAFFPLNQKQAESMKKMKALQPLLQDINKKYAKDPRTKQAKTIELYQKHKVNPVAGCLPLLIQMPIFIALYGAFGSSVELWGAEFVSFWIRDLSKPDTVATLSLAGSSFNLNLLPMLMAGTQILQTKFTTVSGDAAQQKMMMYLMPVIFLFFFWDMPSGLTLYWAVSNVLSIGQQIYTNKKGS